MEKHDVKKSAAFFLVLLAVVAAFPFIGTSYGTYLTVKIGILSLYAIAFNLLFGYCGLLSFGHALFFSGSAYALAIPLVIFNLPAWVGIALALIVPVLFSLATGFLSLRHREIHLTGGEDGLAGIGRGMSVKSFYFVSFGVVFLCSAVMYRIVRSDFGLLLTGLRENDVRVTFSGHSVMKLRIMAIVISAFFTGVAGILWTLLDGTATPSVAHWSFSAVPVIATLIGGPQSFVGPVVGTVVYVLAEDIITKYTMYWQVFLGAVILGIVLFFRGGVVGIVSERVLSRFGKRSKGAA
jgi:branched-chain amino acid transport system permease protein